MAHTKDFNAVGETAFAAVTTESEVQERQEYKWEFKWFNIIGLLFVHVCALVGIYFVFKCKFVTLVYTFLLSTFFGLGVTAGVHRLWCHRSYKAKLPLRLFLALCQTSAMVGSIYDWTRDHRVHHKYSETDADPHNSKRGLFFSHMGWLLIKKHPLVKEKGKTIYLKDVLDDPVVYYQKKYFYILGPFFSAVTNLAVPHYLLGESLLNCLMVTFFLRYTVTLHLIWSVNSFAHTYGYRPYNVNIKPSENLLVSFLALGEGFHNYHHTFPWDYSTSEFKYSLNLSTLFIDLMAKLGLAYDLKRATPEQVRERRLKTGDLDHEYHNGSGTTHVSNGSAAQEVVTNGHSNHCHEE